MSLTPPQNAWQHCRVDLIPDGAFPRIVIADTPAPESKPLIDAAWERMRGANPRLFNGPVLAFVSYDPGSVTLTARRDCYKHLTVQPEIDTGLTQLSVTAILVANDHAGEPHVFFGRRGEQTRIYGGMWELGPSGGIDCPPKSESEMDHIDLWANLRNEITEELGLNVALPIGSTATGLGATRTIQPVALCHDPFANSLDVCYRVELTTLVEDLIAASERDVTWEYPQSRWIPTAQINAFDSASGEAIIPPTRALLNTEALAT
ncbi:MAG: hypothetical protein AAGI53_05220 [Planctomycetota bacterium]